MYHKHFSGTIATMEDLIKNAKQDLLYWAKRLYQKGMSPGTSGNISLRVPQGVLISSTNVCLNDMGEEDVVLIDLDGNVLDGSKKPSSEKFLHTEIYELRDDINAVIHSHCPYITAFSVANEAMAAPIIAEFVFYFEKVPVAPYGLPSSIKLAQDTAKYFDKHNAVLMANHGAVVGQNTLKECFYTLEHLRAYAETYFAAHILGKPKVLNKKQIEEVKRLRADK
jgi:L-fuculose-phosphate aldolase